MTRILHPWIGVVLLISFTGLFIRFFTLNFWKPEDTVWMKNFGKVMNAQEEGLPELGKYNAGQKLVFWGQSILILALFFSGLVLWDVYFADYSSIDQKRLAAIVHGLFAIAAILIWIVHVYAAIWVKGTIRGMTRGTVSGGWAWKHHRKWFRQEVGKP
jgi:formate dehydrogenase subunit gamma